MLRLVTRILNMDKLKVLLLIFIIFSLELLVVARTLPCNSLWNDGCSNGGGETGESSNEAFIDRESDNIKNELLEERIKHILFGNFRPGGRCMNIWDEGCINGQLPGTGKDDDFLNGGSNPGKRCPNGNCGKGNLKTMAVKEDQKLLDFFKELQLYNNLRVR